MSRPTVAQLPRHLTYRAARSSRTHAVRGNTAETGSSELVPTYARHICRSYVMPSCGRRSTSGSRYCPASQWSSLAARPWTDHGDGLFDGYPKQRAPVRPVHPTNRVIIRTAKLFQHFSTSLRTSTSYKPPSTIRWTGRLAKIVGVIGVKLTLKELHDNMIPFVLHRRRTRRRGHAR